MSENLTVDQWILSYALTAPRIVAVFAILPFLGKTILTGLIRNGVALSIAIVVVPVVALDMATVSLSPLETVGLLLKETLIGILIGFPLAVLFWSLESIGFYIDNQRGAAMASSLDPMSGAQTSPLGILLNQAFVVYFFSTGAFFSLLGILYGSYVVWPVSAFFPSFGEGLPAFYLGLLDGLMWLIITFSAPVIVAMFLAELALALISRFAPQLNVFVLAMPIKSAIGIFVLIVYVPILFDSITGSGGGLEVRWQMLRAVRE